jgi:hypothetical protein
MIAMFYVLLFLQLEKLEVGTKRKKLHSYSNLLIKEYLKYTIHSLLINLSDHGHAHVNSLK